MVDSIGPNAACQEALATQFDTIAHNLANSNTSGYKRLLCDFISQSAPGAVGGPPGVIAKTSHDFSQGALVQTDRPLDVAIQGQGFFVLETPQGQFYTRHGVFSTNADGQLVDASGRSVAGESGPLSIPKTMPLNSVTISSDGTLSAGPSVLGKFKLVEFKAPEVLAAVGEGAFEAPASQATPSEQSTLRQGFQEASNVNVVNEMVGLITVSRLYEANAKVLNSRDEKLKSLLQVAAG
jgi:flagellar basal-body rod protein FlgF